MKHSPSRMAAVALALIVLGFVPAVAAVTPRDSENLDNQHITNGPIAEYLADSAASIAWSTRGPAEMAIRVGTDPDHLEKTVEASQKGRGRCHHARIDGLKPDTTYYFQVFSGEAAVGEPGVFKTLPSGAPPVTRKVIVP
jgi:phosphodiesterase/alkaline phosphatase D-like protein